ncbi:hypothetical protein LOK49_LG02G03516 [Camellia lanceoleosa]|uniref:Uncharacterized protein n=1 Tax=Camellia lanceoleosa TaxID=1840588 RepID=A0ACC0ILY8_9ERIC|nr:hypothetical protein LOK49_LG02G03516 [Camellia lanceoleosa]
MNARGQNRAIRDPENGLRVPEVVFSSEVGVCDPSVPWNDKTEVPAKNQRKLMQNECSGPKPHKSGSRKPATGTESGIRPRSGHQRPQCSSE